MNDGAVLIIRLWVEGDGDERHLVARLTSFVDASGEETATALVANLDDLLSATSAWAEAALGNR